MSPTAHNLIMESIMRVTTAALLLGVTACIPEPRPHTTTDAGDTTTDPKCASTQTVTKDLVVDSATMADAVPTGCWTLSGKLTIRGSAVSSLAMLGNVRGATEIVLDNTNLTTFDTEATLEVDGPITITHNAKLADLGKLRAGTVASAIDIESNAALTSLGDAFDDLQQVDTTLTIKNNGKLETIEFAKLALAGKSAIGQSVTITANPVLTDIELPAFTHPNRLEISSNPKLTSIGELPATQIVSDLVIKGNPLLAQLPSLSQLTKIGGAFSVTGNTTLTAFASLPLISYIGVLDVEANPALTSLAGLPGSAQVQIYTLTVTGNAALTDLGRLSHEAYHDLSITSNAQLNNCLAREVDRCTTHAVASSISGNQNHNNCSTWCGN